MQDQMNGLVKIVKLIVFAFLVALFLLAEQKGLFGSSDDCCGMFGPVLRIVGLGHHSSGEPNVDVIEAPNDSIASDMLDLAQVKADQAVEETIITEQPSKDAHEDCPSTCPHAR